MRKLTLALLLGGYLCLALMTALVVWRLGGAAGAGVAATMGALGLLFSIHGLAARALDAGRLEDALGQIRVAQKGLSAEVEKLEARLAQKMEIVSEEALIRSETLLNDMQILEDEVGRIGERLERRLNDRLATPAKAEAAAPQASALLDTVRSALEAGRVDLYLQSVVSLPQRRTLYYESFSRLRDGTGRVLMPAEFLSVAEPGGLVQAIDNLLLFRCVQIVRRLAKQERKVGIFCNISLSNLGDEMFFPQFMDFLRESKDLAGSIIFELGQAAFDARGALEARNMAKLADLGFRFSIDKVTDIDIDFQDLARADVRFVKIAAPLLLDQLEEHDDVVTLRSAPDLQAADYAALARRHGVELVVEKVESERQVVDILDFDIGLGQGNLFGEPRPIREAVLAEAAPSLDFIQAALRRSA